MDSIAWLRSVKENKSWDGKVLVENDVCPLTRMFTHSTVAGQNYRLTKMSFGTVIKTVLANTTRTTFAEVMGPIMRFDPF